MKEYAANMLVKHTGSSSYEVLKGGNSKKSAKHDDDSILKSDVKQQK